MILHLGVIDVPYAEYTASNANLRRRKKPKATGLTKTTGDVAGWLEDKYHVMEVFWLENQQFIVDALSDGLQGSLESILMGAPPQLAPFGSGLSKIDDRFKQFLSQQEIEKVGIPGVPTMAARRGINHRLKRPYARSNPRRPSLIDTGLYQASEKSWIDNTSI